MPDTPDLATLQTRLEAVLDPYRDRLEAFDLYGAPVSAPPGRPRRTTGSRGSARARIGVIRFFLLPMHHHPELLDGISPELRKRKTGASLFSFKTLDETKDWAKLKGLVARAFDGYMTDGG